MTSKQVDLTKNFFALGLMFWLYERSMEPTIAWIDEKFGEPPGHRRGQPPRAARRLRVRRDDRDVPHDLPGAEGEAAARAPTGTSPATRRRPWASSPPRRPRSATCSTAPTRSRRPRTSSTSCRATSRFGVQDLPGRGRDRGHRRHDRRGLRRRARPDRHVRPRRRAQDGGDGPRGHDRAADGHRQRAARRPVDRPADQGGAGGPVPGDLRPQRRVPDARRGAGDARRVLHARRSRRRASRSST